MRGPKNRGALFGIIDTDTRQFQLGIREKAYLHVFNDDVFAKGSYDELSNHSLQVLHVERRNVHDTHDTENDDEKQAGNQTFALGRHLFMLDFAGHGFQGANQSAFSQRCRVGLHSATSAFS